MHSRFQVDQLMVQVARCVVVGPSLCTVTLYSYFTILITITRQ